MFTGGKVSHKKGKGKVKKMERKRFLKLVESAQNEVEDEIFSNILPNMVNILYDEKIDLTNETLVFTYVKANMVSGHTLMLIQSEFVQSLTSKLNLEIEELVMSYTEDTFLLDSTSIVKLLRNNLNLFITNDLLVTISAEIFDRVALFITNDIIERHEV